jgi:uncharacterized protein (TIGR03435 family)
MAHLRLVFLFVCSTLAVTSGQLSNTQFEVASIKTAPEDGHGVITMPVVRVFPSGRVESYGHTLRNLIAWAYDINTVLQMIKGKDQQLLRTKFVISARASSASLSQTNAKIMVRALLEERFQLRWRVQSRDVDGYSLVASREDGQPGPDLRPFTDNCEVRAVNPTVPINSPDYEERARCGWTGIQGRQRGIGLSIPEIAEHLTSLMAAPVSDGTAWPGRFTFDLTAGTDAMPLMTILRPAMGLGAPLPTSTEPPQLLDELKAKLGLKLVKIRATVNDFVIDQVMPLIEN